MQKFVLIPDSFKGTMSSRQICDIMKREIKKHYPSARVCAIPVADGGEGSVDCFLDALGGQCVACRVQGPLGEEIDSFYGRLANGATAVVEMAAAAGLPLVEGRANPTKASTYGVGQLMLDAAAKGAKKIILGLGGSATNDGGCGAAAAAGVRFYNPQGQTFVPAGGTLQQIARIDTAGLAPALAGAQMVAMCDIDNPMYGPQGAAHVFAPQKGADNATVQRLDEGLKHLAEVIKKDLGLDVAHVPGAGAAGAMGAGVLAFFGAQLQMGIETVLDTVAFEEVAKDADMVFTGEGKIDGQSLRGKVVIGVARRAKKLGVPVTAVVGDVGDGAEQAYQEGVSCILSINRVAVPFSQARPRAQSDMALTIDNLMRLFKRMGL